MKWFTKFFSDNSDNSSGELNAFLGTGTQFTGHLQFEGSVRIDGHFQGTISSPGTLILGHEAVIKGEVNVATLNTNGTLVGTVRASRHVHLHEHAVFDGLLITPALGMDQGAIINGTIEMNRKASIAEASGLAETSGAIEALDLPTLPNTSAHTAIATMAPAACCAEPAADAAQNEDGG
ncbi:MAG: hypothetical protein C0405_02680 [Desulfovibrio sp.]|nr:hypothetical protein [Desulfovibrio sp.]